MDAILEYLMKEKVVAVVRRLPGDVFAEVVASLVNGGMRSIEVTMDADDALLQIERTVNRYEDNVVVGAGTVFTSKQAQDAVQAGAKFLVCPHLDVSLLETAQKLGVPLIPGVMTPSEIQTAISNGATAVKVFPASVVGPGFVRDVLGPFSGLSIMVTGGLTLSNFEPFLLAGAAVVGLGSFLFPRADLESGNWKGIETRAQQVMDVVKAL
jgi:2-dehydro-3-deoxyphosphogluconate aldolase/(4S)-4-hydroxy-2-oxoglutarate aldolase